MSWYSKIYIAVREYRKKHRFLGWIVTRLLNALLILQFLGFFLSVFVYINSICGYFLNSVIQKQIYLSLYLTFGFWGLWCLLRTVFAKIARVPQKYVVTQEKADKLKAATPCFNGRYMPEKSDDQQLSQQLNILNEMAEELQVVQAEVDEAGRIKFCYMCDHLKPDRTHHCMSCGSCVVRFDHHCPWINHCVNHRNYKFFLQYVFFSSITVLWFIIGALESVIRFCFSQKFDGEGFGHLAQVLFVAVPFGFFGYYPLGELLIYHFDLLSLNETTCEQAKPTNIRNDWKADYNMGRAENFRQIFGWGLWLFPLATSSEDGIHFQIRYVNPDNRYRLERVIEASESGEDNLNA